MGAHYARWLIARGNSFAPAAVSVIKLVDKLKKEGWLPETGGLAVTTIENTFGTDLAAKRAASTEKQPDPLTKDFLDDEDREELRLVWPAGEPGSIVRYPLSQKPEGRATYTLEVHRSAEYVYPTARNIGMVPTICNCKEDLSFEWDEEELVPAFGTATGIFAECEACSRTFEPSKGSAVIANPFDKTLTEEVRGGAAYRFALVVDCGESFVEDAKLVFAPDLVALVTAEFGRELFEVGALC